MAVTNIITPTAELSLKCNNKMVRNSKPAMHVTKIQYQLRVT